MPHVKSRVNQINTYFSLDFFGVSVWAFSLYCQSLGRLSALLSASVTMFSVPATSCQLSLLLSLFLFCLTPAFHFCLSPSFGLALLSSLAGFSFPHLPSSPYLSPIHQQISPVSFLQIFHVWFAPLSPKSLPALGHTFKLFKFHQMSNKIAL